MRVLLDPDKLNAYGLAAADLRRTLQSANAALPAGELVRGNRDDAGRDRRRSSTPRSDVRELVVGVHDGEPVYLADVARIVDGPPPPARYAWHGVGKAGAGARGARPARLSGGDDRGDEEARRERGRRRGARVEQRLAQLENTVIPAGVEATVTRNYGETADDKAKLLIPKLAVRDAVGRRAGVRHARPARGGDRRRRRAADARGDAVRVVGVGLHAEPRVACSR